MLNVPVSVGPLLLELRFVAQQNLFGIIAMEKVELHRDWHRSFDPQVVHCIALFDYGLLFKFNHKKINI